MAFCSRCGTEVQKGGKFCPSCGLDLVGTTTSGGAAATQTAPAEQSEFDIVKEALSGEYELIKELGRGGMAIVFKARDKSLDREVAIKVLPFSLAFDKDFVERFQREAKTSAKLEHPNIIPIYRVGKTDKIIFFVMKFLRGTSLSDAIEKEGPLPVPKIRHLLAEAARALHYAHQHGIVHRDIKPDNIMFDELGHAIVTDFGIAKVASGTKLTGTGMSIGTPHYMSPEQARAQALDGRSDIYSLGVVAYQCLTGSVPFDGEDSFSIGYKHIMEDLPTPQLRSAEQRDMYEVVRRMMAKSPDERFQNAEQLAQVLEGKAQLPSGPMGSAPTVAMKAAPTTMSPVPPPVSSPNTPTTPMPRADVGPPRPSRQVVKKKRSGALVGMFFLLVVGGGGAGGYWYYLMRPGATGFPWAPGTPAPIQPPVVTPPSDSTVAVKDTTPAKRDSVVKPVTPAKPTRTMGTLSFSGQPRGARVKIDGRVVADPAKANEVDPGSHRIVVEAAGYEPWSGSVAVKADEDKAFPIPSMTRVASRPATDGSTPSQPPVAVVTPPPAAAKSQCETPGDMYNADGSCYDSRAVATEQLVPLPDGMTAWPSGTPGPSIIYVKVKEDGTAERVTGLQASKDTQFHIAALRFAGRIKYQPATKDGRPITAWAQIVFRPKPQ
ncbi:MAG: PEGA domain-containing protein [Gemmatimonadetes bacterium]|nr:PEGA domain-containing protein [Gemmatimonadota bacterium]